MSTSSTASHAAAEPAAAQQIPPPAAGVLYRVVIDSYPTPDGRPFTEQAWEVWDLVGEPEAPDWLPSAEAMDPWFLPGYDHGPDSEPDSYYAPPLDKWCRKLTARKSTIAHRLARVLALGCTAHVEYAIPAWAPIEVTPRLYPATTPRRELSPAPVSPLDDDPPF